LSLSLDRFTTEDKRFKRHLVAFGTQVRAFVFLWECIKEVPTRYLPNHSSPG
jgi:hypothetical protein